MPSERLKRAAESPQPIKPRRAQRLKTSLSFEEAVKRLLNTPPPPKKTDRVSDHPDELLS
jgi:hypothetical protein